MAAVTYDCPLGYVGCALTRPATAWSGSTTPSSRRDAFCAGLKGRQGFAGERQYRCLGPRYGPAVPNRRLQAFSSCPSGLLRAGAFIFDERFSRVRRTNGEIDKTRIPRLYWKHLPRRRNVTGLLDNKVPFPSVFLKVATGGALSGVRVCRRSTRVGITFPLSLRRSAASWPRLPDRR